MGAINTELEKSKPDYDEIFQALSNYDKDSLRSFTRVIRNTQLGDIPGDSGLPIIQHMYSFSQEHHQWLNRQSKKYGPVFRMEIPIGKMVVLLSTEANELVLKNEDKIFSNHFAYGPTARKLMENHLLSRDFDDHKINRKVIQSTFKRKPLEGHMELIDPIIKNGIATWQTDTTIRTMDHLKKLFLDTGAKVFLGAEAGKEADMIMSAFIDIVKGAFDPFKKEKIWFTPFAKGVNGNKTITDYMTRKMETKRKEETADLFSLFCHLKDENGQIFSDEDIRDHLIFILFAAHDTSTSTLCSMLYALADNPEWQEELRQEILDLDKDKLDFDDIETMQKSLWTMQEALRMYPPVSILPRVALKEFTIHGVTIPANCGVIISPLYTHYMPEYWTNPQKFDPMRFSPERAEDKKDFYQYIPFGGGAHKCIGMHFAQIQIKIFLFHLLKSYRVEKPSDKSRYKVNNIPLTFPGDGLPLTFRRL